ncbi:MAG: hypothetical protein U0R68_16160 [Candidatus Nanopelagicales bacterium]
MLRRALSVLVLALLGAVLLGAGPAYADSAADAQQELLDKYAPVVVVREQASACGEGEPYLPTSVDSVLGRTDVVLRGPNGVTIEAPRAGDLAGKGDGWYLDLPGNPLSPGCDYEQWFDSTSKSSPATVYGRVATDPDHPDKIVLQYWFWWVFNDWNDKHEGDWEMIQIVIPADSVEAALETTPESIAFAQHEGSETALWTDPKVHKDGDHVAVYPGQGSHAAYYTQAQWFGKSAAAGFGCDNTTAPGVLVRPQVVVLPDKAGGQFAWLDYTGRWGQKAPSFNNGPTGPNTKTQWTHPVSWQEEEGRPSAVDLPPIGGPATTGFCSLTESGSLLFVQFLDSPAVVVGVVLAVVALIVGIALRTDFFDKGDPELDRPRKAGQMAVAAISLMAKRFGAFWVPVLVIIITVTLNLALDRLLVRARPGEDLTDVDGFGTNGLGIGLALLVSFLLLPIVAMAMATTVEIVDAMANHAEIDSITAFRRVLVHPGGWGVAIGVYIVVTLLATTWWLLPVALFLLARWAVALPATELEDKGVRNGLRRSAQLTKGHRIRSMLVGGFLVWLAFSLPNGVGAVVLLLTGWPFFVSDLISVVVAAVLVPAASIGLTLLYYDLRARRIQPEPSTEPIPV